MNFEVRKPIDSYLDAVDLALLKSGAPRGRRTGIVRDLESHILDVLREKVGDREPVLADIAAVLAALDAPEAFRGGCPDASPTPIRQRRRLPAHIGWSAGLLVTGFVGLIILANAFGPIRNFSEFLIMIIAAAPVVMMILTSSLLGFASLLRIRQQPERYWGRFFAIIEMAAFPILLICASPILFLTLLFTAMLLFVTNRLFNLREATHRFLASL